MRTAMGCKATTVTKTKWWAPWRRPTAEGRSRKVRHSLSGGLNTGSAIAVRFEPLSVIRDRWPAGTAAVCTSTDKQVTTAEEMTKMKSLNARRWRMTKRGFTGRSEVGSWGVEKRVMQKSKKDKKFFFKTFYYFL